MLQETIGNIRTLRECGRLVEALDLTARSLAEAPDDGRLWEEKGLLHDRFGEFDDARDALERATTLIPLRPLARCVLAERYVEMGLRSLAADMLNAAMLGPGVESSVLLRIAAAMHSVDRTQSAVEACRRGAMLDPHSAAPLYAMGYYMERGGWPADLAENMLRRALDFEPDCVRYRVGLIAFLHRRERFDDAYGVALCLSSQQLASLTCACCLVRLFDVFERSEDAARGEICRARLAFLFGRAS